MGDEKKFFCELCGKEITQKKRRPRKTCSQKCRNDKSRKKKYTNQCKYCFICFETTTKKQACCSPFCNGLSKRTLKNQVRECFVCKKKYIPKHKTSQCCSADCAKIKGGQTLTNQQAYVCKFCGKVFKAKKDRSIYCTRECASNDRKLLIDPKKSCKIYIKKCLICNSLYTARNTNAKICLDKKCKKKHTAMLAKKYSIERKKQKEYKCVICGMSMSKKYNDKSRAYCSNNCKNIAIKNHRKDAKIKRKLSIKENFIESIAINKLFDRDRSRCQICNKKLNLKRVVPHPLAATVDHIIPLSCGGTHEYKNVQLACFQCNSLKGNRKVDGGEQLLLFGL